MFCLLRGGKGFPSPSANRRLCLYAATVYVFEDLYVLCDIWLFEIKLYLYNLVLSNIIMMQNKCNNKQCIGKSPLNPEGRLLNKRRQNWIKGHNVSSTAFLSVTPDVIETNDHIDIRLSTCLLSEYH